MRKWSKIIPDEIPWSRRATSLSDLPEVIYFEILSYLSYYDDGKMLAKVNKALATLLVKRTRRIQLASDYSMWRFFMNESAFRDKVFELLHDPYEQLQILQTLPTWFDCKAYDGPFFPVSFLKLPLDQLNALLDAGIVEGIQRLQVVCRHEMIDLPFIPRLQELYVDVRRLKSVDLLNLQLYSSLRLLELVGCEGVSDVSSLDNIYALILNNCPSIVDISCLNHNHEITIINCKSIIDYSQSFRYSKFVRLASKSHSCIPLHLKSYPYEMQYLDITNACLFALSVDLTLILSSQLQFLEIHSFSCAFSLPPNCLQEITIQSCRKFKSLANMQHIKTVTFIDLQIKSLEGLGRGNREVNIQNCREIKDFSPLKYCERVFLDHCDLSYGISELKSCKEVNVINVNIYFVWKGVTSLNIKNSISVAEFKSRDITTVKELSMMYSSSTTFEALLKLCDFPHIEKITIHRNGELMDIRSDLRFHGKLDEHFYVEPYAKSEVLIRRKGVNSKPIVPIVNNNSKSITSYLWNLFNR